MAQPDADRAARRAAPRRRRRRRARRSRSGRRAVGPRPCSLWAASFVNPRSRPSSVSHRRDSCPRGLGQPWRGAARHRSGRAPREGKRSHQRARARISGVGGRCRGVQRRISPARARAGCGAGGPMRQAIIGWPWRLRLRRSARTPRRSSAAPTRSRFPIPSSSQRSSRSATHRDRSRS